MTSSALDQVVDKAGNTDPLKMHLVRTEKMPPYGGFYIAVDRLYL